MNRTKPKRKDKGMKFYLMGNGKYIAVAYRGTTKKAIKQLQKEEWARKQGGICQIVEYTDPRAIYFTQKNIR